MRHDQNDNDPNPGAVLAWVLVAALAWSAVALVWNGNAWPTLACAAAALWIISRIAATGEPPHGHG